MDYLISALIGYLLGSFPTAYLIIKKAKKLDITKNGSGNVGAMNSYEVSRSKFLGILVLVIDALKGLLSTYIVLLIFPVEFVYPAIALLFAVFSHCFNPWLEFKGGRGLATAAGGIILIFPFLFVVWGLLWVIIYFMKRDIIFANIGATVLSLILTFSTITIAFKYTFPTPETYSTLSFFSTALLMIVFIKHVDPLKDLIKNIKELKKV